MARKKVNRSIIYSLIFFFCLFIGIGKVSASEPSKLCYYKSDDLKLNFMVEIYSDSTKPKAVLIKPYAKADFSDDINQEFGAKWDVKNWTTGNSCEAYLKYSVDADGKKNIVEASSTAPSTGSKVYSVKNYDFDSMAKTCNYKSSMGVKDLDITFSVSVYEGAYTYKFDDKISTTLNYSYYKTAGSYQWNVSSVFSKFVISEFNKHSGSCFSNLGLTNTDGSTVYEVSFESISYPLMLASENKPTSVNGGVADPATQVEDPAHYEVTNTSVDGISDFTVTTMFKSFSSGVKQLCMIMNGEQEYSKCEDVKDDGTYVTIKVGTMEFTYILEKEEIEHFFSYSKQGDYLSLVENTNVYINPTFGSDGGNGTVKSYNISNTKGNFGSSGSEGTYEILKGQAYSDLVCRLAPLLKQNGNYSDSLASSLINFSHCEGTYVGNKTELNYYTTVALKNMATYCNGLYDNYDIYKKDGRIDNRMKECIDFDTFYDNLVKANVINDLSSGCGFMSTELQAKVVWLLNIIKIAGPILAIALGALDFVKVIASGEADKEMKTAGKRLLRRFIAAILLFIIPIILAWLMDTVLGDENGYETGNPFCGTIDWSETK